MGKAYNPTNAKTKRTQKNKKNSSSENSGVKKSKPNQNLVYKTLFKIHHLCFAGKEMSKSTISMSYNSTEEH